jgi:hypothetical protein
MQKTNNMAIVSLVAGIVSWVAMPVLAAIFAVVCGHIARKQIRASYGSEGGDMLAIFGLVLGYVNLIGMIVALILVFGVFGLACVGAAVGGAGG